MWLEDVFASSCREEGGQIALRCPCIQSPAYKKLFTASMNKAAETVPARRPNPTLQIKSRQIHHKCCKGVVAGLLQLVLLLGVFHEGQQAT